MSEAALSDDPNMPPMDEAVPEVVEKIQTESAPVEQVETPAEIVPEDLMTDRAQKRFNKITAEKYAEKQRADELQRKLDERQAQPETASGAPKLEEFDYDEAAFNAATIKHQVAEAVKSERTALITESNQAKAAEAQKAFNDRITAMNKSDWAEVAGAIPNLPGGVADALVNSENGAELIYHLGTHLDQADKLASMSPNQAMMELGKISANLNAKPNIKLSAAPEPIAPITSGSSLSKDMGEMSMEEIYGLQ